MAHELPGLLELRTAADILIVDLRMPKKDGLEGITELMSRPTHPRTIALTSSEKATDLRRSLATGTKGYLVKGAEVHDGWNAVREVAAGRSSLPRNVAAKLGIPWLNPNFRNGNSKCSNKWPSVKVIRR